MKAKTIIAYFCIFLMLVCILLCGCKKKEEETETATETAASTYVYKNPPDYGTEGTPEQDDEDIIKGDNDDGNPIPPSQTAQS